MKTDGIKGFKALETDSKPHFKTDARSVKTRRAIKYALMQLLRLKSINDITVKELTTLSDRNRNSFYTHYRSVYDVLSDVDNDVVNYLGAILSKYTLDGFLDNPRDLLFEVEKFVSSHKKAACLYLTSTYSTEIINETKRRMTNRILKCPSYKYSCPPQNLRYVISFFVTGVFDMYYNYLLYDDINVKEITETMVSFVSSGFSEIRVKLGIMEKETHND